MVEEFIEFCLNRPFFALDVFSNLTIALAYYSLPLAMFYVLKKRRQDLHYSWLWVLFAVFIFGCGTTHLVHVLALVTATPLLFQQSISDGFTAAISIVTAAAFVVILPEAMSIKSPRQVQAELESKINQKDKENDELIRVINHRIGNQLQVALSRINIKERQAIQDWVENDHGFKSREEAVDYILGTLSWLREGIEEQGDQHRTASMLDYHGTYAHH